MKDKAREICTKWLEKAFEAGQRCPRFSADASEFWLPLFSHEWSGQMLQEIVEAEAAGKEA